MKDAYLIVVGKLKDKNLEVIENDYLKRLKASPLMIHEVRASAENKEIEGEAVLKKIQEIAGNSHHLVALCEDGKEFNSVDFSSWVYNRLETSNKKLIFIIAGAEGHSEQVLSIVDEKLSLSKLTFPHKIARILFVEQFYRAMTIKINHPYHN